MAGPCCIMVQLCSEERRGMRGIVQSHLLLVLADAARRTKLAKALTRAGFSVLAVADPNSAESLLRIHGHTIRLVILGLALHGVEGLDFASQLASLQPAQEVLYL